MKFNQFLFPVYIPFVHSPGAIIRQLADNPFRVLLLMFSVLHNFISDILSFFHFQIAEFPNFRIRPTPFTP